MNDDKLNKVITETEGIVKNFDRFYKDKLYIDNEAVDSKLDIVSELPDENMNTKKKLNKTITEVKDKSAVAEIDIFGNENIKREEWEFAETLDELNKKIKDKNYIG